MDAKTQKQGIKWADYLLEVFLLILVFAVSHGNPPPDANEAHYLAKAKHYWNPGFAPYDFFLSSADAHLAFYWLFGWLTLLFELPVVAWIGRILSWALLATALVSIGRKLNRDRLSGLLLGSLFVVLNEYCHLAGEWVIGGFEAKTIAYGFAFWAIRTTLDQKWNKTWLLLGAASSLHVLAGGWIVLCLIACRGLQLLKNKDKPGRTEVCYLLLGGSISLCGLIPGLMLSSAAPNVVAEANYLYVHVRLPHHLVITTFSSERIVMFLTMVIGLALAWKLSWRWRERSHGDMVYPAVVSLVVVVAGVLITLILGNESPLQHRLLRFYFYRTGDVLIPLAVSSLVCIVVFGVSGETGSTIRLRGSILLLIIGLYVGDALTERYWDPRPRGDILALPHSRKLDPQARKENTLRIHRHWKWACLWIKNNSPADAIVMTPLRQQTFKWYSERAEVVSRKDMPQDAVSLLEWYERRKTVYPFVDGKRSLSYVSNDQLAENCRQYGAGYLVLTQFSDESRNRFADDQRFSRVYPPAGKFSYYAVFKFVGD